MKKIKNLMEKNVTWGGFMKFTGIMTVISMIIGIIEIIYLLYRSDIGDFFEKMINKIKHPFAKKYASVERDQKVEA